MRQFFGPMGTVSRLIIESQALKSNILGDPSVRVVDVYVPTGHDGQGLPLLVNLVGFTSSSLSQTKLGRLPREPAGAPRPANRGTAHAPLSSPFPIPSPRYAAISTLTQLPR